MIRAHQPGSEPIDIPETIPNPVVVPKPTRTPIEPAPKEPVRTPDKVPGTARVVAARDGTSTGANRVGGLVGIALLVAPGVSVLATVRQQ